VKCPYIFKYFLENHHKLWFLEESQHQRMSKHPFYYIKLSIFILSSPKRIFVWPNPLLCEVQSHRIWILYCAHIWPCWTNLQYKNFIKIWSILLPSFCWLNFFSRHNTTSGTTEKINKTPICVNVWKEHTIFLTFSFFNKNNKLPK